MANFLLLTWKKLWLIVVMGFISVFFHNIISSLLNKEELFFFVIVVILLPAYLAISLLYTLFNYLEHKHKKPLRKNRTKRKRKKK